MSYKVTYIHHSSFMVETGESFLIFDFAGGVMPMLPESKKPYIFVSHNHPDHFNKDIFKLSASRPDVRYILSSDIPSSEVPELDEECLCYLAPGETFSDHFVKVETSRSTDEGVAFWVHVDGFDFYHAGDMNNWFWDGSEADLELEKQYHEELQKFANRCVIDSAFIPVDPRLGDNFYRGLDDFMRRVETDHVFPMHFWGDYSVIQKLKALPCTEPYRDRIMDITVEEQVFYL